MQTTKLKLAADRVAGAVIVIMLVYSVFLLANAWHREFDLGNWIWERHQNLFSWYSRPLFILPACYYAYQRKPGYLLGILALLATSLFWFAPPTEVADSVSGYLEWERRFFLNPDNMLPMFALAFAAATFLFLLFYSLWHRNVLVGLIVLNVGSLLKIAISVTLGGEAGKAAIGPTVSSIVALNLCAFFIWKWMKRRSRHSSSLRENS